MGPAAHCEAALDQSVSFMFKFSVCAAALNVLPQACPDQLKQKKHDGRYETYT